MEDFILGAKHYIIIGITLAAIAATLVMFLHNEERWFFSKKRKEEV